MKALKKSFSPFSLATLLEIHFFTQLEIDKIWWFIEFIIQLFSILSNSESHIASHI